MKMRFISTLCLFCLSAILFAQESPKHSVPRMKKVQIAETGCSVYLPSETTFDLSKSEDGSEVYTGEVELDGFNFAVICVKFAEPIKEKEGRIDVLTSYLDFLQGQFGIEGSAGYGKGHTLESNSDAEGVIDYWSDTEEVDYAIKGWIDGKYLAVLLLYGEGEYHYFNVQEMFLNGFLFGK